MECVELNSIGYNDPRQHSDNHMKWSSPWALSGVFQSDTVHLTCCISGVTDQLQLKYSIKYQLIIKDLD